MPKEDLVCLYMRQLSKRNQITQTLTVNVTPAFNNAHNISIRVHNYVLIVLVFAMTRKLLAAHQQSMFDGFFYVHRRMKIFTTVLLLISFMFLIFFITSQIDDSPSKTECTLSSFLQLCSCTKYANGARISWFFFINICPF